MADPLIQETVALLLFAWMHFGATHPPVRARLVGAFGEKGYQGGFAVIAVASLTFAVLAFNEADRVVLWATPYGWRYVAMAVNLAAYVLLACALLTPSPLAAGMDGKVAYAPRGILHVTRHPMMWGIALWAMTHMVSNGHVASLMLFGTLAFVALGGSLHQEYRKRGARPADWSRLAAATSFVPFAAILAGRTTVSAKEIGWGRMAAGCVLFVLAFWFHEWLSGFELISSIL